jgi:DNA-binding transcriptional LysR family regulator
MDGDHALFVEVIDAGSLSAAGRRLRMSPAAVSKRLAQMEARLGARLIHRTTRRLSPTAEGQAFYDAIVPVLAAARAAEAAVAGRGGAAAGRLRVSAPTSFGRLLVAPRLKPFLDVHPQLRLELDLTDSFVDLVADRIDVAIRIAARVDGGLASVRLGSSPRILCAAPGYIAEQGTPGTLADLARHRILAAEGQLPWRLQGPEGVVSVGGDPHVRTNSSEVPRELAIAGVGIALRSTWDVADALADGRLMRILPAYEGAADVGIFAVWPRAGPVPAATRAFVAWLETLDWG